MTKKILGLRYMITGGAVVLAAGLGTAGVASAATSHTSTTINVKLPAAASDRPDGAPGAPHGTAEASLTGATLTSAVASANAAVPNSTVVRAETDTQGASYEVQLKKADGTYVTMKENASFVVTSTQTGFGTPPAGAMNGGRLPDGAPTSVASGSSN
jgi:hypothetical protein